MFQDKVVVITGGAQGIGKAIAESFAREGAQVCVIDKQKMPAGYGEMVPACGDAVQRMPLVCGDASQENVSACTDNEHKLFYFVGDVSKQDVLETFAKEVIEKYGHVDCLINNALPVMKGLDKCSFEEFQYAKAVGVTAPFYLTKLFAPYFAEGASVINISSSRDRMSQPNTESYTAAKGGVAALTHGLAVTLAGRARVNSISPGWIDTSYKVYEGVDASQHPAGRVGNPMDIANMVLFLCSDKAGFITGENICIDGGMTRQMVYHGDYGRNMNEYELNNCKNERQRIE